MKLSIVIPCYNEEKNIPLILETFNKVINGTDIELLLVDNGSTDNSEEIFSELIPMYSFAKVIKVEVNQGYGFGITSGLKEAKGEYIGYTHADLQTDPKDVLTALKIIERQENSKVCYVKGDRKGRPLFDRIFTIGMSFFETIYLRKKLWDINAQPNVFHRNFFEGLSSIPKDFSLDLYLLYIAQKKGYNLLRFNVIFPPRIHGESKWNTGISSKIKFIKRTFEFSLKLKKLL
jgi:polyisoprenyl-phosphate glycosyltransferase